MRLQSKGKVLRAFFCGDEGAGRKEIRRGSDTCAEKHGLWRYQNDRNEARRLQRSGSSRRMKKEADLQDLCSPLSHAGHRRWITSKS